jgi:hypothetical protein
LTFTGTAPAARGSYTSPSVPFFICAQAHPSQKPNSPPDDNL